MGLILDIAGVAWTQIATKEKSYNPKGATGFGVRLDFRLFTKFVESSNLYYFYQVFQRLDFRKPCFSIM